MGKRVTKAELWEVVRAARRFRAALAALEGRPHDWRYLLDDPAGDELARAQAALFEALDALEARRAPRPGQNEEGDGGQLELFLPRKPRAKPAAETFVSKFKSPREASG